MTDHERIWLQHPDDAEGQELGRMWCQDKVWPEHPEDHEPTEYVRADLYADEIERLRDINREWALRWHSARKDALEEAAKEVDRWNSPVRTEPIAAALRALKETNDRR